MNKCTLGDTLLKKERLVLLVTGATGHSGKWFFKDLVQSNYRGKIRCLVRQTSDLTYLKGTGLDLEFRFGDLSDSDYVRESMAGVKIVLHIAGIIYSDHVVAGGALTGVEWFILVHTTGRYSKFKSASAGYIATEESLLKSYQNLTILRPTMIYGSSSDHNMWKLINFINSYKFFPVFGDGSNLMQPVHAKDLGHAYFRVLNKREITMGKQYNLSGHDPITYKNILKTVAKSLGRRRIFISVPMWLCLLGASIYNFIFRSKAIISVEQVMRMNEDKAFSWENAKNDFDYSPLSFEDGIRLEINELLASSSNEVKS